MRTSEQAIYCAKSHVLENRIIPYIFVEIIEKERRI